LLGAPVLIGAGATTGAGSTIAQNAPQGELTLTRAKQTTVAGWQRPRKLDEAQKAAAIAAAIAGDAAPAPKK
jgi:bifunctional N-acetylglucosamine-1-phosphate-uridyltransferase/glucosamine-1-phosphate-acetyltransferase GlmU-like protein